MSDHRTSDNRGGSWRAWLAAFGIFALGLTLGVAGAAWAGARVVRNALQGVGERSFAERAAVRIGADLTQSLQLTPDESKRVQAILDRSAGNLRSIRQDAAAKGIAELRNASQQIAGDLPPEKRREYRRLILRRYERLGVAAPREEGETK